MSQCAARLTLPSGTTLYCQHDEHDGVMHTFVTDEVDSPQAVPDRCPICDSTDRTVFYEPCASDPLPPPWHKGADR